MNNLLRAALAALAFAALLSSSADAQTQNSAVNEKLATMTLEEKVGQMICPAFRSWNGEGKRGPVVELNSQLADAVAKYNLGGICLFATNCVDTEQTVRLTDQIQNAASRSSSGIPMLITVDQEGGYVTRFNTGVSTPGNMALAATGAVASASRSGEIIGQELIALGFNTNFGPSVDVNNNPNNPVIGVRSFSDDPNVVSNFGAAYVAGLHAQNAISCVKHFPGHGDTDVDSHTGFPKIDKPLSALMQTELVPFASLAQTTDMVMTAHIQFPQVEKSTYTSIKNGQEVNLPATLSKTLVTDVLRNQLGFEGVVTTDSLGMAAISANFKQRDSAKLAILAGVDILLMPVVVQDEQGIEALGSYIANIVSMVRSGEIPESEIDDSVGRILALKSKYGILERQSSDLNARIADALKIVGRKENHDVEWDVALRAIVQVKGGAAPKLGEGSKILYLSPNSGLLLSAQYAVDRLKSEGKAPNSAVLSTIDYSSPQGKESARQALSDADVVILCTKTTGLDMLDVSNPKNVDAIFVHQTLAAARELGKRVTLISAQLPYDAAYYTEAESTLLAFNPSGMTQIPTFQGQTEKYGVNVPAAVYIALGGAKAQGVCPVSLKLNEKR